MPDDIGAPIPGEGGIPIPSETPVPTAPPSAPPTSLKADTPKTTAPPVAESEKKPEAVAKNETDYRQAQLDWLDYKSSNNLIEEGDKVYKMVPKAGGGDPAVLKELQSQLAAESDPLAKAQIQGIIDKMAGDGGYVKVWDPEGQKLYDNIGKTKLLLDFAKSDTSYIGSGGTGAAVESYLTIEGRKTKEIERQYEDFKDRVDQYNQMKDEEVKRAQLAQQMNMQQLESIRDGDLQPGMFQLAGKANMTSALSEILRPSIPDYVRPDYRLNGAVGLPGAEGFDNPNYDQNGFPMFARGTRYRYARGTPRTPDLTGVDPELAPLIGKPVGFKPNPARVINKPWPWRKPNAS